MVDNIGEDVMTWPTNPFYGDVTKDANGNYYVYYDNRWYRNVSLSPLTQPTLSIDDIVLAEQYSIGLDWSEPRYVKYIKFKTPIGILTFDDEEELTLTKKNHKKIKAKNLYVGDYIEYKGQVIGIMEKIK
jgi:hypothetical protein